jgi:hypothetical protein
MRHIGVSKCEQHLSRRAAEALKLMTELRQLRELVRLAEAKALYQGLTRSPVNPKTLDPPSGFQVRDQLARGRLPRQAAADQGTATASIAAAVQIAGSRSRTGSTRRSVG